MDGVLGIIRDDRVSLHAKSRQTGPLTAVRRSLGREGEITAIQVRINGENTSAKTHRFYALLTVSLMLQPYFISRGAAIVGKAVKQSH